MSSFEDQLAQFMAAIRWRESTNNYQIINDLTHPTLGNARGAYQIMSGNWDNWARAAGIPGADWRDPAAQDYVAAHMMTKYYGMYGDWRLVAAAWHGGTGAADSIAEGKGWGSDMDGTPTELYARQVVAMMGNASTEGATSADRAMLNSSIAHTPGMVNPFNRDDPAADPREKFREDAKRLLDAMSSKIAADPVRFATMYGGTPTDDEPTVDEQPEEAV